MSTFIGKSRHELKSINILTKVDELGIPGGSNATCGSPLLKAFLARVTMDPMHPGRGLMIKVGYHAAQILTGVAFAWDWTPFRRYNQAAYYSDDQFRLKSL